MGTRVSTPTVSILAIGDEVLKGITANTNGQCLASKLSAHGYRILSHMTVSDRPSEIIAALKYQASIGSSSHLIVTIGGLGPTIDDRSREAVASWLSRKLIVDTAWKQQLIDRYGASLPTLENQSTIIEGALSLDNPNGTASGALVSYDGGQVLMLPGPPAECRAVFEKAMPFLKKSGENLGGSAMFRVVGAIESDIDPILRRAGATSPEVEYGIYPAYGYVDVRLSMPSSELLHTHAAEIEKSIQKQIQKQILIIRDDTPLEKLILEQCQKMGWTLSICESCTGGLISSRITSIPGASQVFQGGLIAYSSQVKRDLLGISQALQEEHGIVSQHISVEMARSAKRILKSDVTCSTTGFFGPTGGTSPKDAPIGTAFITVSSPYGTETVRFFATGEREAIALKCTGFAIATLLLHLKEAHTNLSLS